MSNIQLNIEESTLEIEHLGFTLRTLLAVAAQGYDQTDRRTWNIRYKNTTIGSVRVKTERI